MTSIQARARMRTAWGWLWPRARAFAVEVGGPGVALAAVGGEVADRAAGFFVHGPAERDNVDGAGSSGRWGDAGQAGQRVGGGEPCAGIADLGQRPSGGDGAGSGQRGEDGLVRMGVQRGGDLAVEGVDLLDERGQRGE